MAGRDGLKGGANAAWIGARLCSSVRARKSGPEPRDATVERREARVPVKRHAGAFAKVPRTTQRLFGAPLPHGMREGKRRRTQKRVYARLGRAMAGQTMGTMNHVC